MNIGVWRSLVARSAGGREVAGSNPVTPICLKIIGFQSVCCWELFLFFMLFPSMLIIPFSRSYFNSSPFPASQIVTVLPGFFLRPSILIHKTSIKNGCYPQTPLQTTATKNYFLIYLLIYLNTFFLMFHSPEQMGTDQDCHHDRQIIRCGLGIDNALQPKHVI